ncbi:15111_t:CDS:2, partial [Acaulospora colombiana]
MTTATNSHINNTIVGKSEAIIDEAYITDSEGHIVFLRKKNSINDVAHVINKTTTGQNEVENTQDANADVNQVTLAETKSNANHPDPEINKSNE